MSKFSIEDFAAGCEAAMAAADDRQEAAKAFLEATMEENTPSEMMAVLNAAIPPGADIGEMIVHASPALTMLYARVPPRFQSGIHNHTIFACIGQLSGEEHGYFYEKTPEGDALRVSKIEKLKAGQVTALPEETIHHIENPNEETGCALHIYGGDFGAIAERRSIWTTEDHEERPFDFQALLAESVLAMKKSGNKKGLEALVEAVPATKPLVDAS